MGGKITGKWKINACINRNSSELNKNTVLLGMAAVFISFCIVSVFCFYGNNPEHNPETSILQFLNRYYRNETSIYYVALLIGLCPIIMKILKRQRIAISIIIFSVCVAVAFVFGKSFSIFNDSRLVFSDAKMALTSLIAIIGYSSVLFFVITIIEQGLLMASAKRGDADSHRLFEKHEVVKTALFLVILWLPYYIAFYPGVLHYDGYWQLKMYYGFQQWTTHHPVFSTWLMGRVMDLGKAISSDELGVAIYVTVQYIMMAFTFGYGFKFLSKWETPIPIRWLTLLFWGIVPIFPMFALNEVKDTMSQIIYMWVFFYIADCHEKERISWKRILFGTGLFIIACMSRNEIKFILAGYMLIVLVCYRRIKNWKKVCITVIAALLLFIPINLLFTSAHGIISGSVGEALSLPFQQTARYMKYYGDDVSQDEKDIIDDTFNGADLAGIYDPNKSDNVKAQLREDIDFTGLKKYIGVWMKLFIRHPDAYISATFNNTYGYYYPEKTEFYGFGYQRGNFTDGDWIYVKDIEISFPDSTSGFRQFMLEWMDLIKSGAFTSFLFHPGSYGLTLLISLFISMQKKLTHKEVFIIPVLSLLICFLSPLNGGLRYMMPITCCIPFVISNCMRKDESMIDGK